MRVHLIAIGGSAMHNMALALHEKGFNVTGSDDEINEPSKTRLKNAGLLTYRWVESVSGPPRKYFMMTDKGLEFYGDLEHTWKELADAVHALTQTSDNNSQQNQ